jgi:hypothetical protein
MSTLTVADQVERVLKPIQQFSRGWMLRPGATDRGKELGLSEQELWIVGRAGVLGETDAVIAAAGLAFIAVDLVRTAWEGVVEGVTHMQVAEHYAALSHEWGAAELAQFDARKMERLDELGRRIADAADGSIGAVFAGTRALRQPFELGARVTLTLHVLRELRGAAHIAAIHACGLTALEAVLVSPAPPPRSGPDWATHLGWTGPFPEATDEMRAARDAAERLTSKILVPIYASLAPDELDEFAELVETTRNSIDM